MEVSGDSDLRAQFERLKRQDAAAARPFSVCWEEARRNAAGQRRPLYRLVPAAAALVLVTIAALLLQTRPPRPAPTLQISQWRSPTAFLLRSPGSQLFSALPRFGEPLIATQQEQRYR